ncbi:MAG: CehA/McbA family metallohydrolase, partial [Candidatus Hydrogenedentes bacterium]|nr:CehA/McbA family metallohydrolase [Candidatus Hydrogenedentota bacterium]
MELLILCVACLAAAGAEPPEITQIITPDATVSTYVLEPTAVVSGHPYALDWQMLVEGEKSWRFRAPFSGIVLRFSNTEGAEIAEVRRHTSCYRTEGWRPAWIHFTAPPGSATVSAAIMIQSEEPLPGHYELRDFTLQDCAMIPPPQLGKARLRLEVKNASGAVVPARIYLEDAAGNPVAPPRTFTYTLGAPCFYFQDPAESTVFLEAGAYRVRAMQGFEQEIADAAFSVAAGESKRVELVLKPVAALPRAGWHSGDHHTHLFRHGGSLYPMMDLRDVYTIAQAEGLHFLPFMGVDHATPEQQEYRAGDFIGMTTEELTRDLWGHICPIGVKSWPQFEEQGEVWPMNYDFIAAAEQAGGAIAYAHPYSALRDDKEFDMIRDLDAGLIAREFPVDVALGRTCTLDLLTKEDGEADFDLKLRDYMRLLDLGFRIGVSGSTDFHLDQGRMPIGGARTYVHTEDLDWAGVARAYREGRTFATNGPLVFLELDGRQPGDIITVPTGSTLPLRVQAGSLWGINLVELWYNGRRVQEFPSKDGCVDVSSTLPVPQSGWLLAIVKGDKAFEVMDSPEGKPMAQGQFAITSPIYLEVTGRPLPPKRDYAEYFVQWIDAARDAFETEARAMTAPPPAECRQQVLERLTDA